MKKRADFDFRAQEKEYANKIFKDMWEDSGKISKLREKRNGYGDTLYEKNERYGLRSVCAQILKKLISDFHFEVALHVLKNR